MEKTEEKILMLAKTDTKIIELQPQKARRTVKDILDLFLFVPLNYKTAVRDLVQRNTYYLITDDEQYFLYEIDPGLESRREDISDIVLKHINHTSFVYNGYEYKLSKRIR